MEFLVPGLLQILWVNHYGQLLNHYEDSFGRGDPSIFDLDVCNVDTYMKL